MRREENARTLNHVMQRAINNGWEGYRFPDGELWITPGECSPPRWDMYWDNSFYCWRTGEYEQEFTIDLKSVIFSHEFARALWGLESWETHLQRMVLAPDPIIYLANTIDIIDYSPTYKTISDGPYKYPMPELIPLSPEEKEKPND